jgi:hypothetical protein|tara:strand:- start:222 stop:653 length:432 start_codon:yes stop_codon:yes gene_type:complete
MDIKVSKSSEVSQNLLQILKQREEDADRDNMNKMQMMEKVEVVEQPILENNEYDGPLYQFVKGDQIDIALCQFLNNYRDREFLKVRFVRENEGVYTFGTKKIFVKLLDTGLKIRVGGGYLNIEEFLEQFTDVEWEKLARRDHH